MLSAAAACSDQAGPPQLIDSDDPTVAAGSAAPADTGEATAVDTTASEAAGDTNGGTTTDQDPAPGTAAPSARTGSWTETAFTLETVANLAQPIGMTFRPGDNDLWLIERAGRVRLLQRTIDEAAGTETLDLVGTPVIDITSQVTTEGEGGLLGITFHPEGEHLYLHYTNRNGDNVISEFPVPAATNEAGTERVLLEVPEPFSNHNGGDLAFGSDGYLYIGLGDGGAAGDPEQNGQDLTTLLGAILRIDPAATSGAPYSVPPDNPYADGAQGRPEIWTWGLRNPWRFSFDAATGDLWIADVGQNVMEEINRLSTDEGAGRGANLGWNRLEGTLPFEGDAPAEHVLPLFEYDHGGGRCSVTGGYVYRGQTLPVLDGVYLYADYCVDGIAGLRPNADGTLEVAELSVDRRPTSVISFGQGPDGEIYVMEAEGAVSRLQVPDWPLTIIRP